MPQEPGRNVNAMGSLRHRLPPLNSLVAFEAVARHLSMTRASEELAVSREAVSRQIHNLEEHLGVQLFLRVHRAVELTPAGQSLQYAVTGGLEQIARTAAGLQQAARAARVTVTATVAIATYWLTPRLARFRERHPETEIHIRVSDTPLDMSGEGIDLGLRYGDGRWQGLSTTALFETETFPVCTPSYLAEHGPIATPADLLAHTLLNLDGPTHSGEDWAWLLDGLSVTEQRAPRIVGFDNYANVIQAALEGQGIALGFTRIVDALLARGQLIRPIGHALKKGHAVWLVSPAGARLSPAAAAFSEWLLAEAERP